MGSQELPKASSFWDHLDELRDTIIRVGVVVVALGIIAFLFKDQLFGVILAPKSDDFITYRVMERLSALLSGGEEAVDGGAVESFRFSVELINTELSQQFITHITMSIYAACFVVAPYILFELFRFVSPALYDTERRYTSVVMACSYVMFMLGAALSYYLIFPLTFRFLGTYQVSAEVANHIVLSSYIGTLMLLTFMMGVMFELPILCWLFAKLGFINASFLRTYRRHAVVGLLVVAAVITPTSDVVTLMLVATPIYLLYEVSILVVAMTRSKRE